MEYMMVCCVQITSTSLVVGEIRRNEATTELVKASPALIQFLVSRHYVCIPT